ncbi:MAG: flavodoxin domain-containing protein, partial [Desulfosalsimonadaceae bacterium]|nr:flavodoxin domain-containing protein [Desulfosalsimonadaceae bacterium]
QITILYDTMWNGTRIMAENIAKGIAAADPAVNVKLCNIAKKDKNDIITEIFKSKGIVAGSPTINKGILTAVAGILEEIKGLKFSGKKAAAFGCYGWSGESVKIISESLEKSGFEIVDAGLKVLWNPDDENLERCVDFGKKLAGLMA